MSLKKAVVERFDDRGKVEALNHDNFAYKDDAGRWRAGALSQTRKAGQFVSAGDAQRIRASASNAIEASQQAIRFKRQKEVTPKQAIKQAYEYVNVRRKAKRQFKRSGLPDAHYRSVSYTDDIFTLRTS